MTLGTIKPRESRSLMDNMSVPRPAKPSVGGRQHHRLPELIGQESLARLRSGDGPLSVRVRPSSLKRDCARRTTGTGGKTPVNVHAKSRLTLEPLRTLRSETKGQAGACPDLTRAIPCKVRVGLLQKGLRRLET